MKLQINKAIFLALALVLIPAAVLVAEAPGYGAKAAQGRSGLTLEEMLTYAIQDEYLARGEYALIMEEYGQVRPFSNIIRAEERHIEWLEELFRKHGLSVPKDAAAEHVVLPASLEAASQAGVQAELDNIAMYESFLRQDLPADVREVFERLKEASENHLRAFRRQPGRRS
ncbi:MAG: DUF2202 domain-containing protein [Spirochaetales bacterium]|nr:DUF2202 domain-containing protein [Spirochaetales bacterium]